MRRSPKPVLQKMGVKPGMRVAIVNAPADVMPLLTAPAGVAVEAGLGSGIYDATLLFVHSRAEVEANAPTVLRATRPAGLLWIAYPKKSRGSPSDISRDAGWETLRAAGWDTVSLVAVNSTWAALRFRPITEVVSTSTRRAVR